MYTSTHLPPPLSHQEFHVLLALSRWELHAYKLKSQITNDSLGSINVADGTLHALIIRLHEEGWIDTVGRRPTGKSGKERLHYGISEYGSLRLKEEFMRLRHLVKIGEANGLLENDVPIEIQRLMLNARRGEA